MPNQWQEALCAYLDAILETDDAGELNPNDFGAEQRALVGRINQLGRCVRETKAYAKELSSGNLAVTPPARDNLLCMPLKNLQANLRHLKWQAKQVAGGDYDQRVCYLGDFSTSFNLMIDQLRSREAALKREATARAEKARATQETNELLLNLTDNLSVGVVVVNPEKKMVLFENETAYRLFSRDYPQCQSCDQRDYIRNQVLGYGAGSEPKAWEIVCNKIPLYYRVNTYQTYWKSQRCYAHIIEDVTAERVQVDALSKQAFQDELTGIYNRRYVSGRLGELLRARAAFTLVSVDIDHLKCVNDRYGHGEGDAYIRLVADHIRHALRAGDVFGRVGGDEFLIIFLRAPAAGIQEKMARVGEAIQGAGKPYPTAISYGVLEIDGDGTPDAAALLRLVDERMYAHKRR